MSTVIQVILFLGRCFQLSWLVRTTVLLLLGLIAVVLARRSRASGRHFILVATFAGLTLLPLVLLAAPGFPLRVVLPAASAPGANMALATSALRSGDGNALAGYSIDYPAGKTELLLRIIDFTWIIGSTLFLIPVATGAWRVRRLRRGGIPWLERRGPVRAMAAEFEIDARIELLLHEDVVAPLTFGIRRHAILLPLNVGEWRDADVRCSLVHELEHIRRHDWIVQAIARMICAVYWFHPLVWIAWRRLCLEAERACDDAAIQSAAKAEREEYAAQLVSLARQMSAAPAEAVLGLANRSDLSTRVLALLDDTQRRGRAGLAVVVPICFCAAVLVFAMAPLRVIAQSSVPHELRTGELPLYPGANLKPEPRVEGPHRGSLKLDHVEVGEASAGAYQAASGPSEVRAFYRKSLQRFGIVTECTGGRNRTESVRIDPESLPNPTACNPMEFGEGETELKASTRGEFWIVTIQPRETGSEFILVHIRDAKLSRDPRAN
jgi:beta-lactamase regulating signal transducer with metallopeptidase domain